MLDSDLERKLERRLKTQQVEPMGGGGVVHQHQDCKFKQLQLQCIQWGSKYDWQEAIDLLLIVGFAKSCSLIVEHWFAFTFTDKNVVTGLSEEIGNLKSCFSPSLPQNAQIAHPAFENTERGKQDYSWEKVSTWSYLRWLPRCRREGQGIPVRCSSARAATTTASQNEGRRPWSTWLVRFWIWSNENINLVYSSSTSNKSDFTLTQKRI